MEITTNRLSITVSTEEEYISVQSTSVVVKVIGLVLQETFRCCSQDSAASDDANIIRDADRGGQRAAEVQQPSDWRWGGVFNLSSLVSQDAPSRLSCCDPPTHLPYHDVYYITESSIILCLPISSLIES